MAFTAQGFINKHKRLQEADNKITKPEGKYLKTMFFSKGDRVGILAVLMSPFFLIDWIIERFEEFEDESNETL